ncbi:MAG: transcriptional repressor NrdR [Dehalococcoidales bacterium]|nr:transcriptional repressor NrdR [Dehalococcoidales bacterium]
MKCPHCGYIDSRVLDSRDIADGVRRRRQCLSCGGRFTTYERIQKSDLYVIKKDKRRELFDKGKLLSGIRKAFEKRPVASHVIDKLADDIEAELYRQGKQEISSSLIGDMVMANMRNIDHIAYIRFASVYREFADITRLKQEVDNLADGVPKIELPSAQLPLLTDNGLEIVSKKGREKRK